MQPASNVTLTGQPLLALQQVAARAKVALDHHKPGNVGLISLEGAAAILLLLREEEAAQQVRALWPRALQANTRYTLDVVAGPFNRSFRDRLLSSSHAASISALYTQQDAISTLQALLKYYAYEDSLTTLQRVQFTTSRYATFSDHVKNALLQSQINSKKESNAQHPGIAPIRQYKSSINAQSWLTDASHGDGSHSPQQMYDEAKQAYIAARNHLATFMVAFDPTAGELPSKPPTTWPLSDEAGLLVNRNITQAAWEHFARLISTQFDTLVTALAGSDELISSKHVAAPPDTELSTFVDSNGRVQAIFIHSPEPLPWRRLWQWITLEAADEQEVPLKVLALWNVDGTRALLIPQEVADGHVLQLKAGILHTAVERPVDGGAHPGAQRMPETPAEGGKGGGIDGAHKLPPIGKIPGSEIGVLLPQQPPPTGKYALTMHFQGNIGAEAPCITSSDAAVSELVQLDPLVIIPPAPPPNRPNPPATPPIH
jgi:hypothetical protein